MTGPESRLRDGARAIAPLTIAAAAFGVSFGVLAEAAGMGAVAPILMSATTFAGSAQFAAASESRVVGLGAGAVAVVARAPLIVTVVVAAVATAVVRAVF